MKNRYYLLFKNEEYFVSDEILKDSKVVNVDYNKHLLEYRADKLNGKIMQYNYTYYGTSISKEQFIINVPENWEKEYNFILGYSHGGYRAELLDIN